MSAGHHRGYRPQDDALPADAQALHLETLGLWRRAATRWQQVLLREADDRVAEAVLASAYVIVWRRWRQACQ
ncbi:Uncharacterised protein [Klebsiella pneumoniae]|nr:Uncharacterised protein [Klebsiella pneumoniae]